MKFSRYFDATRSRPDRAAIKLEWIQQVVEHPVKETRQADGRIRRWAAIPEAGNRYLRVVLLPDGETSIMCSSTEDLRREDSIFQGH